MAGILDPRELVGSEISQGTILSRTLFAFL